MTAILLAIAAQVIVSVVLIAWTRGKVRGFLGSGDEIDRVRREIGSLIVELDASADRNVTVLEDRLSALKDMLIEADKRIAMLGQDRSRRAAENAVYDRLGRPSAKPASSAPRPAPTAPPAPIGGSLEAESRPSIEAEPLGAPAAKQAQKPEERAEPAIPFIRFSDKPLAVEEPFADSVLSLSRRGFSSDIIAARLGATMAEVDLVLSLERERDGRPEDR